MRKLLAALQRLHRLKPETTMWSVKIYSDGSGKILNDDNEAVASFLTVADAISQIKNQE